MEDAKIMELISNLDERVTILKKMVETLSQSEVLLAKRVDLSMEAIEILEKYVLKKETQD